VNWYRKELHRLAAIYKEALPTGFIECRNPRCKKTFVVDFDPMPSDLTEKAYLSSRDLKNNPFKKFDPQAHTEHGLGVFRCAFCGQPFNSEYDFHPVTNIGDPLDVEYHPISQQQFNSLKLRGLPEFAVYS
jgi:hypothetical protein